jgi:hypothetical protein
VNQKDRLADRVAIFSIGEPPAIGQLENIVIA